MLSRTEIVVAMLLVAIFAIGPAVLIMLANSQMKKDERRKPK